jgi:uncharacterized protein (DUF952 family)
MPAAGAPGRAQISVDLEPATVHPRAAIRTLTSVIYKLLPTAEWREAERRGRFDGSAVDRRDGYIHFSDRSQVVETAARHFAGQTALTLLTVDPDRLGAALRWEASRGGALFPHLYAPLPVDAVVAVDAVTGSERVDRAVVALIA